MSKASIEVDFLGIQNQAGPKARSMERRNSFREIQSAISRMNPELLKSVIATGTAAAARSSPGSAAFRQAPAALSSGSRSAAEGTKGPSPLTIFYNGEVAVFALPPDKAEGVLRLAEQGGNVGAKKFGGHEDEILTKLKGDLPIARRKSLQHFLLKRNQRLASSVPYKRAESESAAGSASESLEATMAA